MDQKIFNLEGVVIKKFKKGTQNLIDLAECLINNKPTTSIVNINEITFLNNVNVGDKIDVGGDFEEYLFAKTRIDASRFHSCKKIELKVLSLKGLSIFDESSGELIREITAEAYNKQIEDSHTKITHQSVPSIQEEEDLKKI